MLTGAVNAPRFPTGDSVRFGFAASHLSAGVDERTEAENIGVDSIRSHLRHDDLAALPLSCLSAL